MNDEWFQRLIAEAQKAQEEGRSLRSISLEAGLNAQYLQHMITKQAQPSIPKLKAICDALGIDWMKLLTGSPEPNGELKPVALTGTSIPVIGYVAAGKWLEVDPLNQDHEPIDTINFLPDSSLPADRTFGLIVDGDSLNKIAPPGSTLICVYFEGMAHDVADETLVIVERRRDGGELVEVTAKRYRKREKHIELWPESNHPDWQKPIILNGHDERIETRITGIVKRIVIKP